MKKNTIAAFLSLIFFLLASTAKAEDLNESNVKSLEIFYDVQTDNSIRQTTKIVFKSEIALPINLTLTTKISGVEILDNSLQKIEYSLYPTRTGEIITVIPKKPTSMILIRYSIEGSLFKSKDASHFFSEIDYSKLGRIKTELRLPSGYGLYRNSFLPKDATITSDGKRILLNWNELETPAIISVKFTKLDQSAKVWIFMSFFSVAILSTTLVFSVMHFRKKSKEAFLKGFREDEQKTIKFLEMNKISFQNKLQSEFQFSRAKATRIVMKLEEKGLVKKERCGRTNKVFWLAK